MKKFFIGLLILASAAGAQVVYSHLSGLALDADGSASEPALMFGQDSDTGIYRVTTNTIGIAVGGSQVFRAASAGVTVTGAVTASGAVSGASASITGAVSAGSISSTGAVSGASASITGAVSCASVSATGAVSGASVSATGAVSGASVSTTGDVTVGGYERLTCLKYQDDFTYGDDTRYAADYDIASYVVSVGSGDSNTVVSTPGSAVLTSGDSANDTQVTASNLAYITRGMLPRLETEVTLGSVSGVEFRWGLYNGATKYCFVLFDSSADAHWTLVLNDGTGEESYVSSETVTTDATTLELSIASDGTPAWKINGVTQPITGISKKLTTDGYKFYTGVLSEGAANKTGTLGYIEIDVAK